MSMWFRKRHPQPEPNLPGGVSRRPKSLSKDPVATRLLIQSREIGVTGVIDDAMAHEVIAKLLFLTQMDGRRPIVLRLNSPGGSVASALAIMDTMQFVTAPVHVIAEGMASGMALFLLVSGCPGHRLARPHALLSNATLQLTSSTPDAHEHLARIKARLQERLTTLTKLTDAEAKDVVESDRIFSVEEALACGIIDSVAPMP